MFLAAEQHGGPAADEDIAECYLNQRQYPQAIYYLQRVASVDKENRHDRYLLAVAEMNNGDRDAALGEFTQVIGLIQRATQRSADDCVLFPKAFENRSVIEKQTNRLQAAADDAICELPTAS